MDSLAHSTFRLSVARNDLAGGNLPRKHLGMRFHMRRRGYMECIRDCYLKILIPIEHNIFELSVLGLKTWVCATRLLEQVLPERTRMSD